MPDSHDASQIIMWISSLIAMEKYSFTRWHLENLKKCSDRLFLELSLIGLYKTMIANLISASLPRDITLFSLISSNCSRDQICTKPTSHCWLSIDNHDLDQWGIIGNSMYRTEKFLERGAFVFLSLELDCVCLRFWFWKMIKITWFSLLWLLI